jgi:regulator of protease activity HflC (stomatin/prohibitin superfamily)
MEVLDLFASVFAVVYDGQHALKFTLGRAQGVVGPGVHFKWPIIQKYSIEETKHTTLDLEPQVIQLSDDLVYEVDCKVVYQVVDLKKAIIEIDELVVGLKNRVVMAVQATIGKRTRETVRDVDSMIAEIVGDLAPMQEQWGVRILQFGFSNISPSPTTLEITQLELLANEKHELYERFRKAGLSEEAAVALVSGAVVAVHPEQHEATRAGERREQLGIEQAINDLSTEQTEEEQKRKSKETPDPEPGTEQE